MYQSFTTCYAFMEINTKDLRQPTCQQPEVKQRLEQWTKPQLTKEQIEQKQKAAELRKHLLAKKTYKSVTRTAQVESLKAKDEIVPTTKVADLNINHADQTSIASTASTPSP